MVLSFRRRQDAWQRLHGKPSRERHFTSMMFSVAAVLSLAVAVGLPWWAVGSSSNGNCYFEFGLVSVRAMKNDGAIKTFSCELPYTIPCMMKPFLQFGHVVAYHSL